MGDDHCAAFTGDVLLNDEQQTQTRAGNKSELLKIQLQVFHSTQDTTHFLLRIRSAVSIQPSAKLNNELIPCSCFLQFHSHPKTGLF